MLSPLPRKILSRISQHFVSPSYLLDQMDIRAGQSVLELGSPTGFFAPAAIKKVGPDGSIYVAAPTKDALETVAHLSSRENVHGVLLSDILAGQNVPIGSIDTVILTNLLSNSLHPADFCLSIGQYLGTSSEVLLVDWDVVSQEVGPRPDKRVSREQAIKLMGQCGLEFVRMLKTPGYHYGLVFSFGSQGGNLEEE